MAKGFKHGAGGGASLNFKVVGGTTEPASPKENTIWVDTDAEITGWDFRATQPETAQEGTVWFFTGASSPAEFNAIKKNTVMVYPWSAKQYVDGVWVDREAKIYQNGEWREWSLYLYNKGVEYIDENGSGWKFSGTYTKNATYIRLGTTGGTKFEGYAESPYIDMLGFNTLFVHMVSCQNSGTECYSNIKLINESGSTVIEQTIRNGTVNIWDFAVSVDISAVTSKCKVRITAGHTRTASGRQAIVDFDVVRCK